MSLDETPLQVPAQSVPVPGSVGAEGRAYLAAAARRLAARETPGAVSDVARELQDTETRFLEFLRPLAARFRGDRKSTRLNSSHERRSRMPSSA